MNDKSKSDAYIKLVDKRKNCSLCKKSGLTNPSMIEGGKYDSNEIGPWTRWNNDLNAKIVIVGQEWGDIDSFVTQRGKDNSKSPTNEMLFHLLASIGIGISKAPRQINPTGVFLTNAALCLKGGGAQAPVSRGWFNNCASPFLREQIDLVKPIVVVTLGEEAYRGVCRSYKIAATKNFRDAVGLILPLSLDAGLHLRLVPVYHCSANGLITRSLAKQFDDWRLVKAALDRAN